MPPVLICHNCEQRLNEATDAMRRHANHLHQARQLVRNGLTDEQHNNYKTMLVDSFNEAQSAWDAYCGHLTEHRLLPAEPATP